MVLYSEKNKSRLDGRVVAITGANTGIGKETALDLSKRGARVLMLCRSLEKTHITAEEIRATTSNPVEVYKLDLASLRSVRECAEKVQEKEEKIDILVNNAGIMSCPKWQTEDGFDMQFGTNHLGHFLLTELLLPLIKKSRQEGFHPRIVILSSLVHQFGEIHWDDLNFEKSYNELDAYYQSKLANVLHGKELARRLVGTGITVYVVHPGAVKTDLQRHIHNTWYGVLLRVGRIFMKTAFQGAQTTLYCVLDEEIANDSGQYYADCQQRQPHQKALIVENQKRLWEISEEMVGLKATGSQSRRWCKSYIKPLNS